MKEKLFLLILLYGIFVLKLVIGFGVEKEEDKEDVDIDKEKFYKGIFSKPKEKHKLYPLTPEIIEKHGYPVEIHEIITEDGYILTLQRVPRGQKEKDEEIPREEGEEKTEEQKNSKRKPVVLLQHGMGGDSSVWLRMAEKSFPFLLADAGYDVWLSNTRGNEYSFKHVKHNSSNYKYWNYGIHEMAINDLPAFIDYILSKTNQEKLFYVGHSRGTTMGYMLLSVRPEYNEKMYLFTSFAPVAYVRHAKSPMIRLFTDVVKKSTSEYLLMMKNAIQMLPLKFLKKPSWVKMCHRTKASKDFCFNMIYLINGYDDVHITDEQFDDYFKFFPGNSSDKEVLHYLQIADKDRFAQYDHGFLGNIKYYRAVKPPLYRLEKITAPMAFYYAENDFFVDIHDLLHLLLQLKTCISIVKIPDKLFNHIHFLWGRADEIVYKHLLKLMKTFLTNPEENETRKKRPKYDCVQKVLSNILDIHYLT